MMMARILIALLLLISASPAFTQNQFDVLLYTRQERWHLDNIPEAVQAFRTMAKNHQFNFHWTQMDSIFTSKDLQQYEAIVFLNTHADHMNAQQLAGLKKYINQGGGFVGIHAASAGKVRHDWYDRLIGRVFTDHPKLQSGVVTVTDKKFPAVFHLPEHWLWTDEWYNFGPTLTKGLHTILTVDETSYNLGVDGTGKPKKGMGNPHPIAWYHLFDGGRVFYTSLGHKPEAFNDVNYLTHLYGGIFWAATGRGVMND